MDNHQNGVHNKPLMLIILDGWGLAEWGPGNAIALAETRNFDRLWNTCPHCRLSASGLDVGLPEGQMGNSEVGHMNIGGGRVVYQELTLINKEIAEGAFFRNPVFLDAMAEAKQSGRALHLLGLASDGGVHSHIDHIKALLALAKDQGLRQVFVHCITDGRDTDPKSGQGFVADLEQYCNRLGIGRVVTVVGRFFAMDRDRRWARVNRAYQAFVYGDGAPASTASQGVAEAYASGFTDEFIEPVIVADAQGLPLGRIAEGDSVIFANFRSDRAREISHAFVDERFAEFERGAAPPRVRFVTMTFYDELLKNVAVAYPPRRLTNTLGQVLAERGLKQLRIAETEKYAHVTFFFNGGAEEELPGEDRLLIPSPKVATYDLQPQMSALEVTAAVLKEIEADQYDVIILNFANTDMVGHTGVIKAAVRAVETVDICIGLIEKDVAEKGGTLLITADHGNAEQMLDNGKPMTAHSVNRVPFIIAGPTAKGMQLRDGRLEDIAPTILRLLAIPQPPEMTGRCLIEDY